MDSSPTSGAHDRYASLASLDFDLFNDYTVIDDTSDYEERKRARSMFEEEVGASIGDFSSLSFPSDLGHQRSLTDDDISDSFPQSRAPQLTRSFTEIPSRPRSQTRPSISKPNFAWSSALARQDTRPKCIIDCLNILVETFSKCTRNNTITKDDIINLANELQTPVSRTLRLGDFTSRNIGTKLENFLITLTMNVVNFDRLTDLDVIFPLLQDGIRCLQSLDRGMYIWDVQNMKSPPFKMNPPLPPVGLDFPVHEHHIGGWSHKEPFKIWCVGSHPPHKSANQNTIALEKRAQRIVFRTTEMFSCCAVIIYHQTSSGLVDHIFLGHLLPQFIHKNSVAIKMLLKNTKSFGLKSCKCLVISGKSEFVVDKQSKMDVHIHKKLMQLGLQSITMVDWGSAFVWVTDRGTIGSC